MLRDSEEKLGNEMLRGEPMGLDVRREVTVMRATQSATTSCRYCSDVLIPDVPACEACARIEPRIARMIRAGALGSPVQFCAAVVSAGMGLVCSACDEVIVGPQRNYLGVEASPKQLLHMHPRCARVWQVLGRPTLLRA
jgi:hypothetical protein